MSVIIIGSGGHKANELLRDAWPHLTPEQQQDALSAEAQYLHVAQTLSDQAARNKS